MTVVVIVGILSSIAAVSYTKNLRSAWRTQVIGDLSTLALRQKTLFAVRGHYATTAPGGDETRTYPVAPGNLADSEGQEMVWDPNAAGYTLDGQAPAEYLRQGGNEHGFDALNFMPEYGRSRCAYGTISGDGSMGFNGDEPPAASVADGIFTAGTEQFYARDWFYAFAQCDFDSDGILWTFSTTHVTSAVDTGDGTNWGE